MHAQDKYGALERMAGHRQAAECACHEREPRASREHTKVQYC